ncbi:MAG: hypothetical protein EWM73_01069 [Nitrospira sp.]|nr:MAG: hypothetical protein EWM73_01069 [Nitrospira sp.]
MQAIENGNGDAAEYAGRHEGSGKSRRIDQIATDERSEQRPELRRGCVGPERSAPPFSIEIGHGGQRTRRKNGGGQSVEEAQGGQCVKVCHPGVQERREPKGHHADP